jgi:hypothetical protein
VSASILSVSSKPFGKSFPEWTAEWWKWLVSIPKDQSPLFDISGRNAAINQSSSSVFFLCQTYESQEVVPTRSVEVPASCLLFLPIINWISILHLDGETDEELMEVARERMNAARNLEIVIDGIRYSKGLEHHRALSPFFEAILPENNLFGLPSGRRRAISDGYWVFIRPGLKQFEISSEGSCSSGRTRIRVGYSVSIS